MDDKNTDEAGRPAPEAHNEHTTMEMDHMPEDTSPKGAPAEAEANAATTEVEPNAAAGAPVTDEAQARIALLEEEARTNLDGWQRSRAEFVNYKKRIERELKDNRERAALDSLVRMLPIIDDFERAMGNIPEDLQSNPWVSGTALILKKIEKMFDEFAVTAIDPVGEAFDPNFHEAVAMESSDEYEVGQVIETLQKGYRSGERVLRPALVRVAG